MVLDGGLATELERRGLDLKDELWSAKVLLEQPEQIQKVHESYFRAGADVGTTATYQATFEGFQKRGLSGAAARELFVKAVDLVDRARKTVGGPRWVAASIGSYGASLADGSEYRGNYSLARPDLEEFHEKRLQVFRSLMDSGRVDVLAFETVPSFDEATVIADLLTRYRMGAWVSFSLRDGRHISDGTELDKVVKALEQCTWIWSLGVNCTRPENVLEAVRIVRRVSSKAVLAYPNGGGSYDAVTKTWNGGTENSWVSLVSDWYHSGARLIGGCCRTTPEEILEVSRWRDRLSER